MNSNKRGFTLVELLVVVGMIAVIMGAMATSVSAAQNRARIQKATSEVKVITQAILAYENYEKGGDYKLTTMGGLGSSGVDADQSTIGFLLGNHESAASGGQIPALLMASLQNGGKMRDPWGTPYKIHIKEGTAIKAGTVLSALQTSYFLPNYYRLGKGERQ